MKNENRTAALLEIVNDVVEKLDKMGLSLKPGDTKADRFLLNKRASFDLYFDHFIDCCKRISEEIDGYGK